MNTLLIFAKLENYKFHFTLENKQKKQSIQLYTVNINCNFKTKLFQYTTFACLEGPFKVCC